MFEEHSICILFLFLLHCTGYPVVGPNVLRWTFPIGGTPTKESRLVQLIIGSIMVVSQATIVYLEWLLAPSRKLEDTGGIVTAGVIQERGRLRPMPTLFQI